MKNRQYGVLNNAKKFIRALQHPIRARIVSMLFENGEMHVTHIYIKLRIEQSVCSQHLRILRQAGAVDYYKKGKAHFYYLKEDFDSKIEYLANFKHAGQQGFDDVLLVSPCEQIDCD